MAYATKYLSICSIKARGKQRLEDSGTVQSAGTQHGTETKNLLLFPFFSFLKQWRMVWWQSSSSRIIWRRQLFLPGPQLPLGKGPFTMGHWICLWISFSKITPKSIVTDGKVRYLLHLTEAQTRTLKADSSHWPLVYIEKIGSKDFSLKNGTKAFGRWKKVVVKDYLPV